MGTAPNFLRAEDPVIQDPVLAPDDLARMRRVVIAEVHKRAIVAGWWPRPLLVAASLALTMVTGITVGRQISIPGAASAADRNLGPSPRQAIPPVGTPSQVHFASPGGTRIIWTFNPDLSL